MTRVQPANVPTRTEAGLTKIARGGLGNLTGAAVSALANFALAVLIARSVPASEAGRFFTATSVFLLLETVGKLGADTGLVYFIARWRALRLEERIVAGLRAALAPAVVFGTLIAIVLFVLAPWIAHELGDPRGNSVGLLRLLAALLPVTIAYDICLGGTRGFGTMRPSVLVEKLARPIAQLGLVLAVLALGWSGGIGVGWAVPYLGALVAGGYFLRSVLRSSSIRDRSAGPRWPRPVVREFWRFSLPRAAAGIAQLGLQRLDIILVASMRGAREAAIYTAATRFLVVGQFVTQALNTLLQPHLSGAVATGAMARTRELYRVSTTWLVLISWPLFGLVATLSPLYVRLFGADYRSGAIVVVVLSAAMFVANAVGLVDTVIIMAGRTTWNLATTLLALVVNVGVDLVLIPRQGLLGAAIGWALSILVANVVPLILTWSRLGLHPFGASTFTAYGLCSVCYVLAPLVAFLASGRSTFGAVVGVAVGSIGYALGLVRWRRRFNLDGLLRFRSARVAP